MADFFDILLRNLLSIGILFLMTIVIGKKMVSQLNFFDFIAGITIGSIAASLCIDKTISYRHGVTSLLIWGVLPLIVAKVSLASLPARRILDGEPAILVQNGKILEKNLRKQNYHVNDLLEELRLKGVFNIAEVEFAILETSGQISVLVKAEKQAVTRADMNIPANYQGLSANLIIDGQILYEHLRLLNKDESWLIDELRGQNIQSLQEVLLASLDSEGNLYVDIKNDQLKELNILK